MGCTNPVKRVLGFLCCETICEGECFIHLRVYVLAFLLFV